MRQYIWGFRWYHNGRPVGEECRARSLADSYRVIDIQIRSARKAPAAWPNAQPVVLWRLTLPDSARRLY